jgi:hypothetical protein
MRPTRRRSECLAHVLRSPPLSQALQPCSSLPFTSPALLPARGPTQSCALIGQELRCALGAGARAVNVGARAAPPPPPFGTRSLSHLAFTCAAALSPAGCRASYKPALPPAFDLSPASPPSPSLHPPLRSTLRPPALPRLRRPTARASQWPPTCSTLMAT